MLCEACARIKAPLDSKSSMGREADDDAIAITGADQALAACDIGIGSGADRYSPPSRRFVAEGRHARHIGGEIFGPEAAMPASSVVSGKDRHGGKASVGQSISVLKRVSGKIDGESQGLGFAQVSEIVGSRGLVGIGDDGSAGVGAGELFEGSTVDLIALSGEVACLAITPKLMAGQSLQFLTEGIEGTTATPLADGVPVEAQRSSFGIAALVPEGASSGAGCPR